MFGRTRKAAPQIVATTTGWNGRVTDIRWADGARCYHDGFGLVEDVWANGPMTAEHWDQAWFLLNVNAVRA